jgi:16S rRNA (adenine1518-N6/adenine1519-N6)-dimethyltransferase
MWGVPGRAETAVSGSTGGPIWRVSSSCFRYRPPVPRLKKRLGQHHLRHGGWCRPLVAFLRPEGETVLEIGPGGGVLTRELAAAGARRVWGVEIDLEWAFTLSGRLRDARSAPRVVVADALDLQPARLPAGTLVAGNLPYNVATPLLVGLLPHADRIPRCAFLVQREVAERLAAGPGSRAYGFLSVLVASHADIELLARVPPTAFRPPPRVESAFVGLTLRPPPLPVHEMPAFLALVRQGFSHKRKTLRNALAAGWGRERAEALLAAAGLVGPVRAEELPLERWLELHRVASGLALETRKC